MSANFLKNANFRKCNSANWLKTQFRKKILHATAKFSEMRFCNIFENLMLQNLESAILQNV